jgi:hypothetical protein
VVHGVVSSSHNHPTLVHQIGTRPNADNSWEYTGLNLGRDWDRAYWGGEGSPWSIPGKYSGGGFTWLIPAKWRIGDTTSTERTNIFFSNQVFILGGDGTFTVQKFGLTATRNITEP